MDYVTVQQDTADKWNKHKHVITNSIHKATKEFLGERGHQGPEKPSPDMDYVYIVDC